MKKILTADWYLPELCNTVACLSRAYGSHRQVVRADDLEEAVALLPVIRPDLVISQPSLLSKADFRMLKAASALQPAPQILVWWGNRSAFDALKEHDAYPLPITYVELPCPVNELMQKIDELLV